MVDEKFKRKLKGNSVAGIAKINRKIEEKTTLPRKKEEKIIKGLRKYAKQKITSKRIMKNGQMIVQMPNRQAEDVLSDPNRFFNNEYKQERRNMFFK